MLMIDFLLILSFLPNIHKLYCINKQMKRIYKFSNSISELINLDNSNANLNAANLRIVFSLALLLFFFSLSFGGNFLSAANMTICIKYKLNKVIRFKANYCMYEFLGALGFYPFHFSSVFFKKDSSCNKEKRMWFR